MELRDKVVVVTGGASGIGSGLCRRFREEGVRGLVIADLNGDSAAALASELDGTGYSLDVRDEAAVAAMVAETEGAFGQIDLFCSNAGILNLDEGDYWATSSPMTCGNETGRCMLWRISTPPAPASPR
jgi:NAD(P)-dependent dehydrogenase (short-subunit alcohol dehydrogenase family)